LAGGHDDFEVLVGCDGHLPQIKEVVDSLGDPRFHVFFFPPRRNWGASQRNAMLQWARGDYAVTFDDDNALFQGALGHIARTVAEHPGALLLYRILHMRCDGRFVVWETPGDFRETKIDGSCLVHPIDHARPAWWPDRYGHDADLAATLMAREWPEPPLWIDRFITQTRPTTAGPDLTGIDQDAGERP
jgi:glycosyltransferase involved in cell wall biosynthesis